MAKRKRVTRFRPRKRRFNVGRGRFRVKAVRRILRARKQRKVSKKLHAVQQFGSSIAPKSLLAKLVFYNYYGGPQSGIASFNSFGVLVPPLNAYHRTWNLSSIFEPDIEHDNTGAGNSTVYNFKEYQPFYTKYMVRACKVRIMLNAACRNIDNSSAYAPTSVYIWVDNNNKSAAGSVDTNREAFIQKGRKVMFLQSNCYNPQTKYFKGYFSARKVLKRRLDEDEDYGTITTGTGGASGTNPPEDARMYLHMVVVNNNGSTNHDDFVSYALTLKMYTKLWDYKIDQMDTENPDAP